MNVDVDRYACPSCGELLRSAYVREERGFRLWNAPTCDCDEGVTPRADGEGER